MAENATDDHVLEVLAEGRQYLEDNGLGGGKMFRNAPIAQPVGTCHARVRGADETLCRRSVRGLFPFPEIPFEPRPMWMDQCPDCLAGAP